MAYVNCKGMWNDSQKVQPFCLKPFPVMVIDDLQKISEKTHYDSKTEKDLYGQTKVQEAPLAPAH